MADRRIPLRQGTFHHCAATANYKHDLEPELAASVRQPPNKP